jgi:uncharacterized protein
MSKYLSVIFLLLFSLAKGQTITEPINAIEIYTKSATLYGDAKYKESLAEIDKIDRNDSLYFEALLQKSMIYLQLNEYENGIAVCKEGLKLNSSKQYNFYNNYAVILNAAKKHEEALKVLDEALKTYPKYYLLHYNKAIVYRSMERYPEAIEMYKKAILLNPYYVNSHLNLALLAEAEGKTTQALLSFYTVLILEPNTDRSLGVLKEIIKMVSTNYEKKPLNLKLSPEGKDDFEELDLIIGNYAALSKDYKTPVKLELSSVKQSYLMLSKLSYDKNDKGFWMQTYVPFFKSLFDNNQFEGFTYYTLQSSTNEEHVKLVKKNMSLIDGFIKWAPAQLDRIQETRLEEFNGKMQEVQHYLHDDTHSLASIGKYDQAKEAFIGYVEFYHKNGTMRSCGVYNSEGKKEGVWKYYTANGVFENQATYVNGEAHGPFQVFYSNGKILREGTYEKDKLSGVRKEYYANGALENEVVMKDDEYNGKFLSYYEVDPKLLHYKANYSAGTVLDTVYEYHDNGKIATKKHFDKDGLSGKYITYYKNGKIKSTRTYKGGKLNGRIMKYDTKGGLIQEGDYLDDLLVGKWISYNSKGKIIEEDNFDQKGIRTGILKNFDDDGVLYAETDYLKGIMTGYRYFDKAGKVIKEGKNSKGNFMFSGLYPDGKKKNEGELVGDKKVGLWKYFNDTGNLSGEENYNKEGELEGKYVTYHKNRKAKTIYNFSKDEKEGAYALFYENGQLKEEGWFKDGLKEGYWYTYHMNGKLDSKNYYFRDQLQGYQQYFSVTGMLMKEDLYKDFTFEKSVLYDTTGKEVRQIELPFGNGEFVSYYANDKPEFRATYVNGIAHGKVLWYHYNGKISCEGLYHNGVKHGLWKWFDNGVVVTEGSYFHDNKEGKWKSYYSNGKIKKEDFYSNHLAEGESIWYHENGAAMVKKNYEEDKEEGKAYYYDETGELQLVKEYKEGNLVAYSYNDPSGKLISPVDVSSGTYNLVSYYKNGKKSFEYNVVNREFDGAYTEYYANGNLSEKGVMKNGSSEGLYTIYYSNGKVKSEGNYVNGQLQGVFKSYYPNGKVEKKEFYSCNELHGDCEYYTQEGKLIRKETHYSGKATNIKTF